jgi:hypothetical protein
VTLTFEAVLWYWRGPSPYHFLTVPEEQCGELEAIASAVSYGWGMIPVTATIRGTRWTTSLFPKDGGYVVPVKDAIRRAELLTLDQAVEITLHVAL